MKGMLDTSVLIGPIPEDVIASIEEYAASFIVRAELLRGQRRFERMPQGQPAARARGELVATLDDLPAFWRAFGDAESDAYSRLVAPDERAVRTKDALIAAHALALDAPLLTADEGFSRFVGLRVVTT